MSILRFEKYEDHLRLVFDNLEADFHHRWLRHNSDLDRHPKTRERTLCSSELPDDVHPLALRIEEGNTLVVRWSDVPNRAEDRYPEAWLREHAYGVERPRVEPPSSDLERLLASPADGAAVWLQRIEQRGAVVVRGFRGDTEALISLLESAGLDVVETHFGRIEDLRTDNTTNRNTDQLGYTDAPVHLHTDQPFIEQPPRYQLLHCQVPATTGGENLLADAEAASRWFRATDLPTWEQLSNVPVHFDRRQKNFQSRVISPILDSRPGHFRIRYSYFTMAPYRVPFERMASWYRAFDRFARFVRDPRHHYSVRLGAGDLLLYDNWRMLHARTGFSGPRWMRGVYFDRRG